MARSRGSTSSVPADAPWNRKRAALAWILLLFLTSWVHAQGWSLPGIDDVLEPDPDGVAALLSASNQARATAGLPLLSEDAGLARAARQHAAELAQRGLLDHGSPTPGRETVAARLARAGVPYTSHGENLAFVPAGMELAATTVDGWMGSPPHRANLLDASFDRVGFGTAVDALGSRYVVQVLAAVGWAPQSWSVLQGAEDERRLLLEVDLSTPMSLLFEVAGVRHAQFLGVGRQALSLPAPLQGPLDLRIGVLSTPPSGYTIDEQGRLDSEGRWTPGTAPRRHLRLIGAAFELRTITGVHLELEMNRPAPGLELLVGGQHLPGARTAEGRITAFLPWPEDGAIDLALAEGRAGGQLLLRHAFVLRRTPGGIVWEARP